LERQLLEISRAVNSGILSIQQNFVFSQTDMKKVLTLLFFTATAFGCGEISPKQAANDAAQNTQSAPISAAGGSDNTGGANAAEGKMRSGEPKNIRDFFMLLPEKYFTLEGCDRDKDKDCKKAREEYLKTFGEVVDVQNGYIKGGCDGGQACIEMAIFKRPDGTYLVGMATFAEMMNDNYFLDYSGGVWTDVSATVVPEFSKKNLYELPRVGTVVKIFEKKITEQGDDFEASEKGKKLYDLKWQDGKFTIVR
jgi:hypothetical protein